MRYSERSLIGCQGNLNAHWDNPPTLAPQSMAREWSPLHVDELQAVPARRAGWSLVLDISRASSVQLS